MSEQLSYRSSGVDISVADAAKREMAKTLETDNSRVLNKVGAFASLFDGKFPEYEHPVLVLKTEEPGSKQKLAFTNGHYRSICFDMINHLVNDIVVMGARPLTVQDAIICGKLDKDIVTTVVKAMAEACKAQDCVLTGGETSEQPGVLEAGTYILTSSIVGVVERSKIIDGSRIKKGDIVLAVASNGLHTNGYSLVRTLMQKIPDLAHSKLGASTFLEVILEPHTCYYHALKGLFGNSSLHGLAHITGGGIAGNLNRVLPKELDALIDLSKVRTLPVFGVIKRHGTVEDSVMLETYNAGVGLTVVCDPSAVNDICTHVKKAGHDTYPIGEITSGSQIVNYAGKISWS